MADHVCPWWVGYILASPIRKLVQNPHKILEPYVEKGITAIDVGPGMGFFTLPMAQLVGDSGKVLAVDLQKKMIDNLKKRAKNDGVGDRIETFVCTKDTLGLTDFNSTIDFALLFNVLHEMPFPQTTLSEIRALLKTGKRLLFTEPAGHKK